MVNALVLLFPVLLSFTGAPEERSNRAILHTAVGHHADTVIMSSAPKSISKAEDVDVTALISFAKTLKGTPYKYACADPKKGFDCSGFVMYVFNHFQMNVPRSSIGFTNIGKDVDLHCAMPGDIILFTGTNSKIRKVGHVGIITQACDSLVFIHASSGKTHSVTETALGSHYKERFIKVIRLLE